MIVLVRHGEAMKNLRDEHGGNGSSLSAKGQAQAKAVASMFVAWRPNKPAILSINKTQCLETAGILAKELDSKSVETLVFPTFSLGILDGMTVEATRREFPAYAHILDRWRDGNAEAAEVSAIPGATDAEAYFRLGQDLLVALSERCSESDLFVVGTRSVLVCLGNIVLGRSPKPGGNYREIAWQNCGVLTLVQNVESKLRLEPRMSNVARFI